MRAIRSVLVLLVLLLAATPVLAQKRDGTPIQQQMSAEEFKAAGLDKLSTEELARLNAWLNNTVVQESQKAVAEARRADQTAAPTRAPAGFGGGEAFEARLVGHFAGFERGKRYTLDNGQVWQQVDDATMYGVKLDNPTVQLKPSVMGNAWFMRVDGRAVNAKVKRIK